MHAVKTSYQVLENGARNIKKCARKRLNLHDKQELDLHDLYKAQIR
jgi:hypothetical protein